MTAGHVPVLLEETLAALALAPGHHLVDATFGEGGVSARALALGARVTAFDRDPCAIAGGRPLAARHPGRLKLVCAPFSRMAELLGPATADAVTFDLGVSSRQLEDPTYGLSFRHDGPLDMRLSREGVTAAQFLNSADEEEIARVLRAYGEEPAARRIARAIIRRRPLATTADLRAAVVEAVGATAGRRRDPATRTFQAIRIHVNAELDELAKGLDAAEVVLRPGGRLAVVSFHSLEDRLVKTFLAERSGRVPGPSRHRPPGVVARPPTFERPARPVRPSAEEVRRNPRARSAVLRSARRRLEAA
ncbi:MAG: 16S rRNA (cytosine(1402)-N(4))-methyltransferase RsmH [Sphingomonadaceae bacterium]|uniref:16S rRNA (cytosine(1402)-N(4))-methyltransferase RsmH n=1 Tax=Thermaurantiacus sp. TaxID=2820283 RepID=UPI00298F2D0C|nr:16S rRNA (cytosine(1402)-N(4))-methyltransferase RsmH [Thermaurantiacus sp.]MCS6986910.1 16S rRNA (cytosine(1402)-N(4))-methyltransferase RsmH [Sphingomonadaceae bacterium]MDW8415490.1 16S rRNA (cytosine(1402)-N(4))-methyltransferase RsmH [Thermaurantiacus sp.]